ncbi:MAG TPA: DNA-processing protein DprA [Casimicrobiaceae bacterium]|nr:DNA-processing protein DprA [Casimicrobiaceae bacterium]
MALDARSLAWATLAHKALPQRALVTLLRAFDDPAVILDASAATLGRHVPAAVAAAALAPVPAAELDATRRWLDDPSHHLLAWDDGDYPRALLDIGHAPPVLFYIGVKTLLNTPAIAIVGSRMATPQGRNTARDFANALADAGLTIVSGLAHGVDSAAHEGALPTAASTLAVIGTGPDRVYPARNRDLARRIAERGGIVSEFLPGTPPRKENFPRRNRLISGLARGVLVVEATLSSGSLITARWAGEQGRDVFAIPGSIHSPFAKGCHKLIRDGAKLVETAQDVLIELGMATDTTSAASRSPGKSAGEAPLLAAMGYDAVTVDDLVARTGLTADAVLAELVRLELDDRVSALPGGAWQRLTPDS